MLTFGRVEWRIANNSDGHDSNFIHVRIVQYNSPSLFFEISPTVCYQWIHSSEEQRASHKYEEKLTLKIVISISITWVDFISYAIESGGSRLLIAY